jgi:hypothetical protein
VDRDRHRPPIGRAHKAIPALVGLLGRYNWWAPPILRRLHERLGLAMPRAAPAAGTRQQPSGNLDSTGAAYL